MFTLTDCQTALAYSEVNPHHVSSNGFEQQLHKRKPDRAPQEKPNTTFCD